MKKLWLILSVFVLCSCYVQGQNASYYQFNTTVGDGTYVSLTDATELKAPDDVVGDFDDYAYISATEVKKFSEIGTEEQLQGFEIGFDFTLGGQQFDRFMPTSEGYVALASGTFSKTDITATGKDFPAYAVGLRGDETTYRTTATVVAYKLTGEAGNRVLAVEYRNQYYKETPAEGEGLNYTVRLYENGGKMELYFGSMASGTSDTWFNVGFTTGTDSDNKHYRNPAGTDWTNTSYGSNGNKNITADANFPKGMTWTFTEPAPCVAPTDPVVSGIDIIRPEGFRVIYDFGESTADGYVAFVSTEPLADGVAPVNGTVYTYNDELGAAKFSNTDALTGNAYFSIYNTEPANTYYVYTYLYNERCKGDRMYGLRQTPAILLSAPALEMTYENDRISLWPKGTDTLVVLATTVNGEKDMANNIGKVGRFGIPTPDKKVGDTLWTSDKQFGGIILYKNLQPAAAFDYDEVLKPYTNYHFAAFRRDADGGYVSAFAQADTLTPPAIPFVDDFSTSTPFAEPAGYTGNGAFQVQKGGSVLAMITMNSTGDDAHVILETPEMLFPADADARLIMEYNFIVPKSRFESSLKEEDYNGDNGVYFSVSEDGGEWQPVYAITKNNPDLFASAAEYKKKFITLGNHNGKPCRVRIEVVGENLIVGFGTTAKVTIASISIVEKPACDAPLTVSVPSETVYGDSARVIWTPFEADEQRAGIAYRLENEATWHTLIEETTEDTVNVGGLPNRTKVVVGVKTHCTGGAESVYTESEAFRTGYQMPFIEDFSTVGVYDRNGTKFYGLQEDWAISNSPLGTLGLKVGMNALYGNVVVFNKATQDEYDPSEPDGDKCMRFEATNGIWLVMPPVSLAEGHEAELSFDAALLKKNAADAATDVHTDAKFIVYATEMAEEDGMNTQAFAAEDAILTLGQTELAAIGAQKQLKVAVPAALTGKVRFGFYYNVGDASAAASQNQFYLDNLGMAASCGQVVGLQTVSVGETEAVIGWRAYPGVGGYKVTVTEVESGTALEPLTVTEPKVQLTGLEKATDYKISVSYACSDDEDAPEAEITFTTGGVPCYDPADLTATEITKTSAVLGWTGEAETYNLEYKEATAETFVSRVATATTYNLTNLKAGTDYVFRVQSVCNAAAGDMSEWTETKAFKTEDLTCFAPTEIKVTPSFSQAEVVWEGDADQYQFAYRQGTDAATPWTTVFVANAKKYLLTDLKAETVYQVRLRSICAAGDTSAYSAPVDFTTTAMTPCPVPAQLRVEDTTFTSAKMAWDGDEQHESYLFRYRETTATVWDSVKDLTVKTYTLDNLKANTAYIWSVNAACNENRTSGWATANEFKTPEEVANEDALRSGFDVYATNGHINILNRSGLNVSTVEVYAMDGRKAGHYTVNTNENVLLPVALNGAPAVVALQTEAGRVTYKILLP